KAGKTEVIADPPAEREEEHQGGAEIVDLMALLKRSVRAKGKDRKLTTGKQAARRTKRAHVTTPMRHRASA
ncbi:MAG: hypothetical protein ACT4OO_11165, partial [Nitrospiraceae bacterium]